MLISLPFAWLYLLPERLIEHSYSIITSIFFSANFYFWQLDSYTAAPSALQPFLHNWSLSVEEQFYLLYPLILVLLWKHKRLSITIILTIIALLSLILSEFLSTKYTDANFYLIGSRIWELIIGGLIANYEIKKGLIKNKILNYVMPTIGIILIVYSFISFNNQTPHPSLITLIPVIGTAFIILFSREEEPISRVLSSKTLVFIGTISYSLYLWHQPIFAFARLESSIELSSAYKTILITLTFILSIISWYFIERPFRNKKTIKTKLLIKYITCISISLLIINIIMITSIGFPKRFHPMIIKSNDVLKYNTAFDQDGDCHNRAVRKSCNITQKNATTTIYVVGDSHMRELLPPLIEISAKQKFNITPLTTHGCHYAPGLKATLDGKGRPCSYEINLDRQKKLLSSPKGHVIIGSRLPLYLSGKGFNNLEGGIEDVGRYILEDETHTSENIRKNKIKMVIQNSILELLDYGHQVVLIYPVPEVGWNVSERLLQLIPEDKNKVDSWLSKKSNWITTSYKTFKERTLEANQIYDSIGKHRNLIRIYPENIVCNTEIKGRCITHNKNQVFYRDDDHFSLTASKELVKNIIKEITN